MAKNIIVIGASAGGVRALQTLVTHLPSDLSAAVFLVLHMTPDAPSHLAEILQRKSPLKVYVAEDGAPIVEGQITVCQPDHHLVVEADTIRNTRGPKRTALGRRSTCCFGRRRLPAGRGSLASCSPAPSTTAPPGCGRSRTVAG